MQSKIKRKKFIHKAVRLFLTCALLFPTTALKTVKAVNALSPETYSGAATVTTVVEDNIRVQLLSETVVRIETKGAKGWEDRPSYLVQNRTDWETVAYERTEGSGYVHLSTANYVVVIPSNAVKASDVFIVDRQDELLWKSNGATTANVYLPSPSDELKSWYFTDTRVIPSENGYNTYESQATTPLNGWDFSNKAEDHFVFLPGGSYKQFCKDYIKLTGKSEMVTQQMLGFWDSRWYAYSAETALQQIKDYTDKGYSIDVLVIDTDWRAPGGSGGIGYDIDTKLFPDMAAFLEECHKLGVSIVFNDHPEPVSGVTNGLNKDEVDYRNKNIKLLLSLGLDTWWYDRNWHTELKSADESMTPFAFGMYAYQWMTDEYYESITDIGEYARRGLIMANIDGVLHGEWKYASDIGAHRYSMQWTGDIGSTSSAIDQEIYATVFGGAEVGLPYLSSDIGGHTQPVTDAAYVRWLQYGALSSIFRVHCTTADFIGQEGRMPWMYGETAEEVAHKYQDMRYRLMPLYYNLASENYNTGLPLMRRLDINYPQYHESARNDQYLLGDYLLVAPVTAAETTTAVPKSKLQHEQFDGMHPGLKGEYFTNKFFTGAPAKTVYGDVINHDWGYGGPSDVAIDTFSVRWTGQYKVGDKGTALLFKGDDGFKVRINGVEVIDAYGVYDILKTTPYYPAGSVLDIEVIYYEDGGRAHISMYETYQADNGGSAYTASRNVFLPDGNWIDVFSGKRYSGPTEIKVTHGLETSPIFVREGAIIPLANNGVNTQSVKWDKMALDLYPSREFSASQNIYEDDTSTVAYKSGVYRNTSINMSTVDAATGKLKVNIGAGIGNYTTDFNSRQWTLRMHMPEGWGDITKITVDGKPVSFKFYSRNCDASPLTNSGAAADAAVYEVVFTEEIAKASEVEFSFASTTSLAKDTGYDKTEQEFSVSTEISNKINLTSGYSEWAVFGMNGIERIDSVGNTGAIGKVTSYMPLKTQGYYNFEATWNAGAGNKTVRGSVNSQKDISFTLNTKAGKQYFTVYLGGYETIAKITVRDKSGKNVKTNVVGRHGGGFTNCIVIEADSEEATQLYVTYSAMSTKPNGTGTYSAVTLSAIGVSDTMPTMLNDTVSAVTAAKVSQVDAATSTPVNLSTYGQADDYSVVDWMKPGYFPSGQAHQDVVRKAGGTNIELPMYANSQNFYDYKAPFFWNDGDVVASLAEGSATIDGKCSPERIDFFVRVDSGTSRLVIWTGAWQSNNKVTVYDLQGNILAVSEEFNADNNSVHRRITFDITATGGQSFVQIAITGGGSNVSLAAVGLLKK